MSYQNKIIIAINYVDYSNVKKRGYQEAAMAILASNSPPNALICSLNYKDDRVVAPSRFEVFKAILRDSGEIIGNSRSLPYVKEIFDFCAKKDCKIFGYFNSDILVHEDFFDSFNDDIDAYLFSRTDISEVSLESFNAKNFKIIWTEHPGYDGIFFRREWWLKNRDKFHEDLILGEPFWDYYYHKKIKENTDKVLERRSLYHVYHNTEWKIDSKGALNNMKINGGTSK